MAKPAGVAAIATGEPAPSMSPGDRFWLKSAVRAAALLVALLILPGALCAQQYYRIVNPDGTISYTDRRPESLDGVKVIKLRAEEQPLVRLRIEGTGSERRALAANLIAGPLQVELRFADSENASASPALPLRALLPSLGEQVLAAFAPGDPRRSYRVELGLTAVPGDPDARHDESVYLLPVQTSRWEISQGWDGAFSHRGDQARFAIDISVDEGTPVLAARAGSVMQVERHFEGAGLDPEKFGGRANHVRVLHADGSMAVYAHLETGSVLVRPGTRVRAGQQIANSGNTGFSSGPHLHFAIQLNRGMKLVSVPFRLEGPDGEIAISGAR